MVGRGKYAKPRLLRSRANLAQTRAEPLRKEDHNAWILKVVLPAIRLGLCSKDLVIVMDNALAHNGLEARLVLN